MRWANEMLVVLGGSVEGTLAEQLGRSEAETKRWLEEKLGWLRGYTGEVRVWSYFQKVVKEAEEEIKRAGLSRTSWRKIQRRLSGESRPTGKEREFRRQVSAFVQKEGAKVPLRQQYLGSSDVLESLFGEYKDLADQAPSREITANVLTIPLLVTPLTPELLAKHWKPSANRMSNNGLKNIWGLHRRGKSEWCDYSRGSNTKGDPEPA